MVSERRPESLVVRLLAPPAVVLTVLGGMSTCRMRKEPPPPTKSRVERGIFALLREVAAQDWLVVGYLLFLVFRVQTQATPRGGAALVRLGGDLVFFIAALVAIRGKLLPSFVARALYRVALFVPVLGSFLQLQYILPAASGAPVDGALYALDLRLFGFEPAEAMDALVTPATTEWFAFFYYGYFFLIATYVIGFLVFGRERLLGSFGFGFLWVYCVGQAVYTVVPAYGPYAFIGDHFRHPLAGNTFWPLVQQAVASVNGSARTDVFPSLHTAVPTFLAAFSFRNRAVPVFRRTWFIVAFVASQMVLATMFLRWHYLVDVVAGLCLAASALVASHAAAAWERSRRSLGGQSAW